ncbi:hypothetical protein ABPG74_004874 [Tetrahymena malaccensis]
MAYSNDTIAQKNPFPLKEKTLKVDSRKNKDQPQVIHRVEKFDQFWDALLLKKMIQWSRYTHFLPLITITLIKKNTLTYLENLPYKREDQMKEISSHLRQTKQLEFLFNTHELEFLILNKNYLNKIKFLQILSIPSNNFASIVKSQNNAIISQLGILFMITQPLITNQRLLVMIKLNCQNLFQSSLSQIDSQIYQINTLSFTFCEFNCKLRHTLLSKTAFRRLQQLYQVPATQQFIFRGNKEENTVGISQREDCQFIQLFACLEMLRNYPELIENLAKEFNQKHNNSWNEDLLKFCIENYEAEFYEENIQNYNQYDISSYADIFKQNILNEDISAVNKLFFKFIAQILRAVHYQEHKQTLQSLSQDEQIQYKLDFHYSLQNIETIWLSIQKEIADIIKQPIYQQSNNYVSKAEQQSVFHRQAQQTNQQIQNNIEEDIKYNQLYSSIVNSAFDQGDFSQQFKEQVNKDINYFNQVLQNFNLEILEKTQDNKSFYFQINDKNNPDFGNLIILVNQNQYKIIDFVQKEKADQILKLAETYYKLIDLVNLWWYFEQDQKNSNKITYENMQQNYPQQPQKQISLSINVQKNKISDSSAQSQDILSIHEQKPQLNFKFQKNDPSTQYQDIQNNDDSDFYIMNSTFQKGNFSQKRQDQIKKDIKQYTEIRQNINLDLFYNPKDDQSFYIIIGDSRRKYYGYLTVLVTAQHYEVRNFFNIEKGFSAQKSFLKGTILHDIIKFWWSFEYYNAKEDHK